MFQLFLLVTLFIFSCQATSSYFINENYPSSSPDGSSSNPFTSLSQAVSVLGTISCSLYLRGDNITISSTLNFPSDSNYVIQPDPTFTGTNFPFVFKDNGNIKLNASNLTLNGLEIIDLNTTRPPTAVMLAMTSSNLYMQNILMRDIIYSTSSYLFIRAMGPSTGNEVVITDSTFTGLYNVELMALIGTRLTMRNNTFKMLVNSNVPFIIVSSYTTDGSTCTLSNFTLQDVVMGSMGSVGFFTIYLSRLNLSITDFTIKNVTVTNQFPIIMINLSKNDSMGFTTSVAIKNGYVEGVVEGNNFTTLQSDKSSLGLFLRSQGPSYLAIDNLTLKDVRFKNYNFVSFIPAVFLFSDFTILPQAQLTNIDVSNSTNTNFWLWKIDTATFENITIRDNTFSDFNVSFYLFDVQLAHKMSFKNIFVENNTGPIMSTEEVMLLNITNFTANNVTLSQDFKSPMQNIISITLDEEPAEEGLDPTRPIGVTMTEINVNGFADIKPGNSTEETNFIYFIFIWTILGENYFTNSHWQNIVAGGFSSQTIKYIKIQNVKVEQDIGVPFSSVMKHEFFAFIGVDTLEMENCQFFNNQNAVLFSLYNIERTSFFQTIKVSKLTFTNITAINNTANYIEENAGFPSAFSFYSPQKPVSFTIQDSTFYNNTVLTGLISINEINELTSVIKNNKFDLNVAVQSGGVIWATYLRQNTNTLSVLNNTFTNNFCQGVGGVYYFVLTNLNINLSENNYTSNSATTSGGVGYISRSDVSVTESNSVYTGNSAGSNGGAWYLNLRLASSTSPRYTISNVQFIQSTANQRGGAFFIEAGNLAINNCSFQKSKALNSGSEFYISATSLFQITNSNFTETYGSQAAFIYGDNASSGSIYLSNISITNIQYTSSATLLQLNQGLLKISRSNFSSINCPLFDTEGTTVTFKKLSISDITCKSNLGYCIMTGSPTTLTFNDSNISNIVSNSNLISLTQSTKTAFNNVQFSNVKSSISAYLSSQTYVFKAYYVKNVSFYNSSFASLQFSGIKTLKSSINILSTNFSNQASASTSRLLQSSSPSSNVQFFNAESSNTYISKSIFTQNSLSSSLNGGAIRIIGTGGTHEIDESTFQSNFGINGGAISVEGKPQSFILTDSDFLNNIASRNGGSIVFARNSVVSQPMISGTSFIGNQAKVGGALFIPEQVVIIQNSLFTKNQATSVGGAIASFATSSNVYIQDNVFSKNKALQGAALMSLGSMVFMDSSSNIFEANLATYGSDVATNPISLRLQVYQVSNYYVFLDNATPSKMLANDETVLIYDSANSSLQSPLLQNSGVNPNFLYKFSLYDGYENVSPTITDISISLSISSFETTGRPSQIGILGTPIFTAQDNSMYLFNSISLRGSNDTSFVLAAHASYYDSFTAMTRALPVLEFPAQLTPCARGQVFNNETSICTPCGSGTYSLGDPSNTSACVQCLDHAICLGGDMFYPEPGYWRIDAISTNFIPCIQKDSCLGGILVHEAEVSQTGFCAEGYEGVSCSVCSSGYAKFGDGHKCENCADDEWYYVRFGLILCVQMAVIAIAVWTMINKIYSDEKKAMNLLKSSILLITIDFLQVLNLISEFNFKWPSSIQSFWSVTTKIVPSNADALSIDCFLTLIKGNSENLFYIKVIILVVQPFFYIGVGVLFWMIRHKMTPVANRNRVALKGKIAITIITIVYILMPGIIKSVLDLFKCRNYGSLEDPQNFLADDTNVECWNPSHWAWSVSIAIPALIIWLAIPLTIMFAALYKKPYSFLVPWTSAYRNVFDRYKEKLIFWELLVLTRKLIIIAIALIISSTYIQSYVAFVCIFVLLQLHDRFVPAQDPDINTLEVLNLYTIVLIIYSGLYFIQSVNNTVASNIILSLDFVCGGLFLFYTLRFLYRIFRKKINPPKIQATSPVRVAPKTSKVPKPIFRKQTHGGFPFALDSTSSTNPIRSTTNTEAPLAPTMIREKDVLTTWSIRTPRAYGRSFVNWKRLNPRPITQLEALNLEAHLSPRSPKSLTSLFQRRLSFQEGSLRDLDHLDFKRRSIETENLENNENNDNNDNHEPIEIHENIESNENNELETDGQSERLTTTDNLVTSPANDEIAEEAILMSVTYPRLQRAVFFEQNRKWK